MTSPSESRALTVYEGPAGPFEISSGGSGVAELPKKSGVAAAFGMVEEELAEAFRVPKHSAFRRVRAARAAGYPDDIHQITGRLADLSILAELTAPLAEELARDLDNALRRHDRIAHQSQEFDVGPRSRVKVANTNDAGTREERDGRATAVKIAKHAPIGAALLLAIALTYLGWALMQLGPSHVYAAIVLIGVALAASAIAPALRRIAQQQK